jgi:hypothetical protein
MGSCQAHAMIMVDSKLQPKVETAQRAFENCTLEILKIILLNNPREFRSGHPSPDLPAGLSSNRYSVLTARDLLRARPGYSSDDPAASSMMRAPGGVGRESAESPPDGVPSEPFCFAPRAFPQRTIQTPLERAASLFPSLVEPAIGRPRRRAPPFVIPINDR